MQAYTTVADETSHDQWNLLINFRIIPRQMHIAVENTSTRNGFSAWSLMTNS